MKKIMSVILIFLFLMSSFTGCSTPKYRGFFPELYTVAIYNFLGSYGFSGNGEISTTSKVGIIETDSYGRVLFYYHEGIFDDGCGYGILQKSADGYAYYYDDDCIACSDDDWQGTGEITHDEWFTEEEIAELKLLNDWEQPINEEKCTKKPIVSRKATSSLKLSDNDFENIVKTYCNAEGIYYKYGWTFRYEEYFMSDDFGREMYFLCCNLRNGTYLYLAAIINPDGSFDSLKGVIGIKDMNNYREAMKEFKLNNGWNTQYTAG